jgi:YD repeat-containing protein
MSVPKVITGSFPFIVLTILMTILLARESTAQYYYKDLVATRQNTAQWKLFRDSRVRSVRLNSFEGDGQPTEGFQGEQEVTGDFSLITTHTKTSRTTESWIIAAYSSRGLPIKITDTSDTYRSITDYQYDAQGRVLSITNTSIETDNHVKDQEQHLWQYDAQGKPTGMLKIKNGNDTTFIRFVTDEKGNIAEERAVRNKADLPVIYYYYDADNRLTDIVHYSLRAQRLLPSTIFTYDQGERLASMLVVPEEGNPDYQKWLYEYNEKGLKIKEACFNKRRELLGRIEYQYRFQ